MPTRSNEIRGSRELRDNRHWAIPENIHTYTTDGFLDFRRGGGVHDYGILRAWGVFTFGNPKAWGGFTGGISGVESVELVLCKRYCCGLLYFVNKPWTYDWESRRQTSIDQTRIYARNLYKWTVKRGFHTYLDKIISCHMNKIYKWILQLASCLLPCDKQ